MVWVILVKLRLVKVKAKVLLKFLKENLNSGLKKKKKVC